MITKEDTSVKPIHCTWTKSVLQLIVQATITAAKKSDVRRMFANQLIARPTIIAESNKSVKKVLSHVKMSSAVITHTATAFQVDHTDVTVKRASTNVKKSNAVIKNTAVLMVFAKRTNVKSLSAETYKTAKINSLDQAKNVNLEHASAKRENASPKNAKHTKTVKIQHSNTVVTVSKTNVSSNFWMTSLEKPTELAIVTNIVLLV